MSSKTRKAALISGAVAVSAAIAAVPALAHTVEVVGGATKQALANGAKTKMKRADVSVGPKKQEVSAGAYSFHALDDGGGGEITHTGKLGFRSDDGKVNLKQLEIVVPVEEHHTTSAEAAHEGEDHGSVLNATVGGEEIAVADLNTKHYEVFEDVAGFEGLKVKLTKDAASMLNEKLDVNVFKNGMNLGTLTNTSEIHEEGH
jgi:hypothetical protein